ncbi:winged helix-turn-helix domain-containing protein [Dokdonella sp.]|uniref:winged helix-turn-helix domain-containing protein n=1 Tax=Dokdonella sp. TaxID=2291710 RepID=UPI001B0BC6EC|nr:winged helix-turn-helix domain-containing protein [Dokdonella sp.]MBO9662896.1 winged helix-turn-helix domain-containing protein [Dokdonella sp.]
MAPSRWGLLTSVAALEYSFEGFRVKVAERELWCGDALLSVNRYIFDSIAYLIEHRDRAVGRDELVAAVWGRVEVTDGHLNQIIARARRALDDNAQTQRLIRTVPGFGYRWISEVDARETKTVEDATAKPAPAAVPTPSPAPSEAPVESRPSKNPAGRAVRAKWRWQYAALALLVAVVGVWAVGRHFDNATPTPAPAKGTPTADNAVIVLPFVVEAPSESAWLELGAMDLVAERLRVAGLRVSPSKTVVTALHGADLSVDAANYARIRNVLGGDLIVQGKATRAEGVWSIELAAANTGGVERRVEARGADAIKTARAAADLLLAATGHEPPHEENPAADTDATRERLQQAQAASLANELDLARSILHAIPDAPPFAPELRFRLAELDFRAGHYDQAAEAVEKLLADPSLAPNDVHRGRALILRGNLNFRRSDFSKAITDFNAAVTALDTGAAPLDLCDALTRRGLTRVALEDPDGALADYGRAYLLAEQSGDRLRVAHIETGFGQLQIVRHRLELALPHLNAAIERYEAFGVVERVVTLRSILIDVYSDLLRWADVLPLAERQWQSRERIGDPGLSLVVFNRQARVLMSVGRYREAGEVIDEAQRRFHDLRPGTRRYLHDMQAELASRLGQPEKTVASVDAALESWPRAPSFDRYAYLVLLRQRALIAQGHAEPERIESWLPQDGDGVSAVFLLARAEWAAQQKAELDAVQSAFDRALAKAEDVGLPVLVAMVAQSYVDWLLAHQRRDKAAELAGRVAVWANDDYESALIRVKVFHALGSLDAWRSSLGRARELAGERVVPARLAVQPVVG